MGALLVYNERARRGRALRGAVLEALGAHGIALASEPPYDAIVAAGGDGTVVGAIGTAMELQVPLGIIALGTFNDLARTLGIPLEIDAACAAIAARVTRTIDVGRVNGACFVNEASIGLSARIARRQTPEIKRRFGFLGVAAAALRTLRHSAPFAVRIVYDGESESFRTSQLTVANSDRFGGWIRVEGAAIDDGWLDLYSVETRTWWGVLPIVRKMLSRDPKTVPGLRVRRAARFQVITRRPHRIAADGEPAGRTPAVFDVLPRAVEIFIPATAKTVPCNTAP